MRILILASHHGDEHSGEKLYAHIKKRRPELLKHIVYKLANPKARKQNVRYIESDMNRGYRGIADTYEKRRAQKILDYVNNGNFDLVLDMHNTGCDQPSSLIVASINPRNERFIRASSMEHLVIMNKQLVETALNGNCPQSVSIEITHDITDEILDSLCDDIARYIDNQISSTEKHIYKAELLYKNEVSDEQFRGLRNFEMSKLGFYPILVGEQSYQKQGYDYLGFKALKRRKFKV